MTKEQQNSVPYPGMSEAFEIRYGQSFVDRDWRNESSVWAAAWKAAKAHDKTGPQAQEPLFYYKPTGKWTDGPKHASWITQAHKNDGWLPLYTEPPLRDLSDDEIAQVWSGLIRLNPAAYQGPVTNVGIQFARAIIAKARGTP